MHDVWEPTLVDRIDAFMDRKSREFPELKLRKKWYDYETTPKPKRYGRNQKLAIQ